MSTEVSGNPFLVVKALDVQAEDVLFVEAGQGFVAKGPADARDWWLDWARVVDACPRLRFVGIGREAGADVHGCCADLEGLGGLHEVRVDFQSNLRGKRQ